MPRYITRPQRSLIRATYDDTYWSDGVTAGDQVHDDGSWSEDQPTGLLDTRGDMILRVRNSIGYLADN